MTVPQASIRKVARPFRSIDGRVPATWHSLPIVGGETLGDHNNQVSDSDRYAPARPDLNPAAGLLFGTLVSVGLWIIISLVAAAF